MSDPTDRFSDRADHDERFRPGNPQHARLAAALRTVLDRTAGNERAAMLYDTHLCLDRLDA